LELPSSIYIGLGAIAAAIITGAISFINLIASKDQKTSEFRQQWINGLRADISEYLSHVDSVSCQAHLYQQLQCEKGITKELLKEFSEKVSANMESAIQLFHSIQLRLNVTDDSELISSIKKLHKLFDNALANLHDTDNVEALVKPIISQSQTLLKDEWIRVKTGEDSYVQMKTYIRRGITFVVVIAIALILIA
jgi:hypothetical protein